MDKPKVVALGRAVIEQDSPGFLVMLPSGDVRRTRTYAGAVKKAKEWFAEHTPQSEIGVGEIVSFGETAECVSRNGWATEAEQPDAAG